MKGIDPLSRNTCRAFIASGDKVGFSYRIFMMRRASGWEHFICFAYPISRARRDHSTRHCYVILITMSKQPRDQFWPVKTCKMQCYRDKRHRHTFRRDTYNGVVSFFIRSVNKCFSATVEWNMRNKRYPIFAQSDALLPGVMKNYVGSYLHCQTNSRAWDRDNPGLYQTILFALKYSSIHRKNDFTEILKNLIRVQIIFVGSLKLFWAV